MPDALKFTGLRPLVPPRRPIALELIGRSATVGRLQELVCRAAALEGGVLIVGERGVDAEPLARELHARSRRAGAPYVLVECAGGGNLDRLLFGGVARSADLEVVANDSGLAAAAGGTLFLHDVTELPSAVQARLARVARDGEVRVEGAPAPVAVRLVAGASREVDDEVEAGHFRPDLFRRLAALRVDVPPLRERREDIPDIAARILADECVAQALPGRTFTDAALALVAALTWPGNVAELHGVLVKVVADTHGDVVRIEDLLSAMRLNRPRQTAAPTANLRDARLAFERDYISSVLQHHCWRMADAARTLGIQRPNLYRKARQLGIPLPKAQ